jgi:ABC-type multidrug transport system fused ATPase/permease subunit
MVFFGLDEEEYDRKYSNRELWQRITQYFSVHKEKMVIVIFFISISSIMNGLIPYLTSTIINSLLDQGTVGSLIITLAVILGLNLSTFFINYVVQLYSAKVIHAVVVDLRLAVTENILLQDLSFFDKYPTGKIVSRVNSDSFHLGEAASIFMQSLSSILALVVVFIPLLFIDLRLTGIFSVMIPAVFLFTMSFRKIARKKTLLGQRSLATVNAFVQESMAGIQIAKTFRQERKLYDKFNEINSVSYKVNISRALFMNLIFPGLNFIQGIMLTVIFYIGGLDIISQTSGLNPADLFLFLQSQRALFFPLFMIAAFWPQFQTGMAAAERIFALIDSQPLVIQTGDVQPSQFEGQIDIEELMFHYTEDRNIFNGFDLSISPGESIAIVGHTGAGKSSLARILLRFYEFQSGTIKIDGHDIRSLNLGHYRKHIGIIPQTPFLWADTLENNVRYGVPEASTEQVEWALEQAGGKEWVKILPQGLQTNIRERGKLLSMGQRQLVVFARVLLQNPSILILDEATASVDPFTETRIQEATQTLMENRTSIVIAHRLHTVRHVDRIIVLDHGKIVEQGNHEELMDQNGYYSTLYNTYFKHQSYEYIEEKVRTF